ncbi:MAG: ArsA-related P-loop ATPase [Myxococcota bacterium]
MGLDDIIKSRRIFFITGKGGTGKSTYTVSLGKKSALRYKTLIVDFDNKRSTLREILRFSNISTEPVKVDENLFFSHIEPEDALKFYLVDYLKSEFLINLALNLKPLKSFYRALPSAKEMLITYFLLHLVKDYDFQKIFIDMPASGHAELFLKIPYAAKGIFQRGPVINIIREMNRWLYSSENSGVIQISLPDGVVISETIEFFHRFNVIENIKVLCIIVNKKYDMKDIRLDCSENQIKREILELYNYYLSRYQEQQRLICDLKSSTSDNVFEVPFFPDNNQSQRIFEYICNL